MNNQEALITLIILTIASAFFSSSETSMMAINRYRLKHLVKSGNRSAKRVYKLLAKPDKLLGVLLIGNTFANLLFSSIFTQWAITTFGDLDILGSILLTIVSSLVLMIFAESTPKTFAALYPQKIALPGSWLIKYLLIIFYPCVWLVTFIGNNLLRMMGVHVPSHHKHNEALSHEELRTIVHESGEHFPAKNTNMLLRLLDLNYTSVEDVMIPRSEIMAIDLENETWSHIQKELLNWPHSQVLFYADEIDNIQGYLDIKDLIKLITDQQLNKTKLIENLKEVYFIPETTTLASQLLNFQNSHRKSGLVVNEYGDIMGFISLQDILEEVVGEFDQVESNIAPEISKKSDGSVHIEGATSVRDINRELKWELPEDGPKTLSGLIIEHLEHIPEQPICLLINNYKIEILSIQKNTIKLVKIYP